MYTYVYFDLIPKNAPKKIEVNLSFKVLHTTIEATASNLSGNKNKVPQ